MLSLKDRIKYKNSTRGNMDVLLISDPLTLKCSACMAINVGSLDDGKYYGMAHLMEHLLIMRKDNKLFWYLHHRGGTFNATTRDDKTNYYFDIWHPDFEKAIEIFSEIFKTKKFEKEFIKREVDTVNSEYAMNKSSDVHKIFYSMKDAYVTDSPNRNFSVGSSETLGADDIDEAAWKFFQEKYLGRKITLVIYGNQKLEEMQSWLEKYFSDIPFRPIQERPQIKWNQNLTPNREGYYRGLNVQTRQDSTDIYIFWYLPNVSNYYDCKPINLLVYTMLDYGKDSLISYLIKHKLLIRGDFEGFEEFDEVSSFVLFLKLTSIGWANREMVLNIIFSFIYNIINSESVIRKHYMELQKLNNNLFLLNGEQKAMYLTREFAFNLLRYPKEHVIDGNYYMNPDYDAIKGKLKEYFDTINPNNCVVVFANNEHSDLPNQEKWFGGKYKKGFFKLRENIIFNVKVISNPFIPTMKLYPQYESNFDSIKLSGRNHLWYQYKLHNNPKLLYGLFLRFNNKCYFQNLVLQRILKKEFKSHFYYLHKANCGINIKTINEGMLIFIDIYPQFLELILPILENLLAKNYINDSQFQQSKKMVLRNMKNLALTSTELIADLLGRVINKNHIGLLEVVQGLEKLDSISNYPRISKVYSLLYGNFSVTEIKQILKFQDKVQLVSEVDEETVKYHIPKKKTFRIKNPNPEEANDLILMFLPVSVIIPGETKNWAWTIACLQIIIEIIDGDFFDYIRVQKRLAYQLDSDLVTIGAAQYPLYGISLVVKSDKDYATVEKELHNYLIRFKDKITPELVDLVRKSLILVNENKKLFGKKSFLSYFTSMTDETLYFKKDEDIVRALKNISHTDIEKFYQKFCCGNADAITIVLYRH